MANMSYCRFENTYSDLRDCVSALRSDEIQALSEREQGFAEKIGKLCEEYLQEMKNAG